MPRASRRAVERLPDALEHWWLAETARRRRRQRLPFMGGWFAVPRLRSWRRKSSRTCDCRRLAALPWSAFALRDACALVHELRDRTGSFAWPSRRSRLARSHRGRCAAGRGGRWSAPAGPISVAPVSRGRIRRPISSACVAPRNTSAPATSTRPISRGPGASQLRTRA